MEIPQDFDPDRDVIIVAGPGATAFARKIWSQGYDRVLALETPDPAELAAGLAAYANDPPKRAMVASQDPKIAEAIRHAVARKIRGWNRNALTTGALGDEVRANTRENLRSDRWESVEAANGKLAGFPLVSVMPGPSLDRNAAELREARDRVVVIEAIQAARPLRTAGVKPDGIIVLDPGEKMASYLADGVTYDFAVCSMGVDPRVIAKISARRWFACALFPDPGVPFPVLASAGNTATALFSLAVCWGANPIILVGHDFAYAGEQTYARGTGVPAGTPERYDASEVDAPGLYGGTVRTSRFYDDCRQWMEEAIALCPDRRVINATAYGAKIAGSVRMPVANALRKYAIP